MRLSGEARLLTMGPAGSEPEPAEGPRAADPSPREGAASSAGGFVYDLFKAMRPYQWVKNLLLFWPLLLAHEVRDVAKLAAVSLGFVAFSFCASAGYVVNDLRDREADRLHPVKRRRPFAAGRLSVRSGVILVAVLVGLAFACSGLLLPWRFTGMLALYLLLTLAYSLWLKKKLLVDVFLLAGLYTHRVIAGAAASQGEASFWLLGFCIFLFLSLAFAKRYAELTRVQNATAAPESGAKLAGRAYEVDDLGVIETVGPTSGYMSVLVLALYMNTDKVRGLYDQPFLLWMVCPLLLYWLTRVWFLAKRRLLNEDPILFALKDRVSLMTVALAAVLVVCAAL